MNLIRQKLSVLEAKNELIILEKAIKETNTPYLLIKCGALSNVRKAQKNLSDFIKKK